MTDTKHNGWTNYATWRVNLEMFDATPFEEFLGDADPALICAYTLADALKERAEYYIECEMEGKEGTFAESYARAFLSEVNWDEIARHIIEGATA